MHSYATIESDIANLSPAFHDTRVASLIHVESEFMPDELRWHGPPPATWLLLVLAFASLAPLFLALALAASLP